MNDEEIKKTISVFHPNGGLFEIRLFNPTNKNDIYSGIFRDADIALSAIKKFNDNYNIYFTFNRLKDALDGLPQFNRMIKGSTAIKDTDIKAREWVLVDFDPIRADNVKDVASTEEEKERAHRKAIEVYRFLLSCGFSSPVVCFSGNGYHLQLKVDDIDNTAENTAIISGFLRYLSLRFSDDYVDVDTAVFNASRITKLYGTYSRKGGNTENRPHRLSKLLVVPSEIESTDIILFKKLADLVPKPEPIIRYNESNRKQFDIDDFISKHGINVFKDTTNGDGTRKIILDECPFDPSHKHPDSAIFISKDGIGFTCFHNSCSQYTWKDVRLKYEPDAYDVSYKDKSHVQYAVPNQVKKEVKLKDETPELGKKWYRMKDIPKINLTDIVSLKTGFTLLDKVIVGLNLSEVSILSGSNSSGKSSWINTLILNIINNGYKAALWSGELRPDILKTWIQMVAAGKRNLLESKREEGKYYVNPNVINRIDSWMDDKFFLYNNQYGSKWAQIFHDMKELVDYGVKLLILDNLFTLDIDIFDGDRNNKQKELILQICKFAKENQVHIILVCHPRKQVDFLRKDSISGTSDLTNAVDNVFIIHRVNMDFQKKGGEFFGQPMISQFLVYGNVIEVAKNRMYGVVDYLCGMYYDIPSRRFKNTEFEDISYGWEISPKPEPAFQPNDYEYSTCDYNSREESDLPFDGEDNGCPF